MNTPIEILIVEDSATQADQLKYSLEQAGYSVSVARNGVEALQRVRFQPPALVISDVVMPDMNGYSLCRAIKSDAALRDVPVILLTSLADARDIVRGIEAGANYYFTKPYHEDYLLSRVACVLPQPRPDPSNAGTDELRVTVAGESHVLNPDRQQVLNLLLATYENAVLQNIELFKTKRGLHPLNQRLEEKVFQRTASLVKEINERKAVGQQLRLLAAALETSASGVLLTDPDGTICWVNPALTVLTGYSSQELIGQNPRIFKSGKMDPALYADLWQTILAGRAWRGEFINRRKDGSLSYDEHTITPVRSEDGAITHFVAIINDVTERRRSEEALRASQEYSRNLIRGSLDMIIAVDRERKITEFNEAAQQTFGYTFSEVLGQPVDLLYADPLEGAAIYETIVLQGSCVREIQNRRKNGDAFTSLLAASQLRNTQNDFVGVMGISRDITAQKREQEERAKLTRQIQLLLESTGEGICGLDLEGACTFINGAGAEMLGYRPEEIAGKPLHDLIHPHQSPESVGPEYKCPGYSAFQSGRTCKSNEAVFSRRDGSSFPAQCSCHPILEGQVLIGAVVVFTDITERKRIERQSLRNQRLESIGTLAGGIAHDLNNVLAPILMSIEILRSDEANSSTQRILATIESSAQRGAEMVKQILAFARGVEGRRVTLQIAHLIKEVAKILKQTLPKTIEVYPHLAPGLWPLSADVTQLHQVLINLCVNARDAMPDGGRLTIKAANFYADETYARMHRECQAGPHVVVSVIDTGTGIPENIQDRMFDPFFTTKPLGNGSGLGLSTVRTIVKSHGGFVTVYSKLGRGTEFNIYLPSDKSAATERVEADRKTLPAGSGQLLLVVDDEAAILDIAKQTLEMFGYQVLTAKNGAEAIALCAERRGEIKLMLTDMMMPIMDGAATIQAIKTIQPELRIIAASGIGSSAKSAGDHIPGVAAFMQKPYTAETLLKAVHKALSAESGPE